MCHRQSVKIVAFTNETKAIDGNKKINGGVPPRRKRHIMVDTQGLVFGVELMLK
jgi:hypothetical protein